MNQVEVVKAIREPFDIKNVRYECENDILENKRIFLNEDLKQLHKITLSTIENSRKNIEKLSDQFKKLNLKNEKFWQGEVSRPKLEKIPKQKSHEECRVEHVDVTKHLNTNFTKLPNNSNHAEKLKKKYFRIWKDLVNIQKTKKQLLQTKAEQNKKLDSFVKHLKTWKKDNKQQPESTMNEKSKQTCSSFKNRFEAQKVIIDMQRSKLERQNQIIEELKLGIIREDLLKSMENSKATIHELFSDCSERLKCKMPILLLEEHKFKINIQKAPKVIQKMEQRAVERARNREIILERKRLREETSQKLLEEALENKRILEEEEKKRQLELMQERRKRELALDIIRQANKRRFLEGLAKAVQFHNNLLVKQCFVKIYNNMLRGREKYLLAKEHYRKKILSKYFNYWMAYYESLYAIKYAVADSHYSFMIMKRVICIWREYHLEEVRNMQVAEDYDDLRLTKNAFAQWERFACNEVILRNKKMKMAINHYKRKMLFQYFYQWMSLKAVKELEKAKEMKKKRWREKVWEILPDYKPPEDY